jgi:hypothetical protein
MIGPPTYVGLGKRLNYLLLLERDFKFSESRRIPVNVLDISNGKFGCLIGQPGNTSRRSAAREMLLTL